MRISLASAAAAAVISTFASADLSMSGYLWGGGFPGPSNETVTELDSQGGTGGGTTGGGLGESSISVAVNTSGATTTLALSGFARHPDSGAGHTTAFSSDRDGFGSEGLLITLDQAMDFSIINSSFATSFAPGFGPVSITPARLTAVSGFVDSSDGLSGRLAAGTYLLDIFISGFAFDGFNVPSWAGYQPLIEAGNGVEFSNLNWSLNMTAVPAPGGVVVGALALMGCSRRRR
jgi:hypothetical protein